MNISPKMRYMYIISVAKNLYFRCEVKATEAEKAAGMSERKFFTSSLSDAKKYEYGQDAREKAEEIGGKVWRFDTLRYELADPEELEKCEPERIWMREKAICYDK